MQKCWKTNVTLARGDDEQVKAHNDVNNTRLDSSAREYPTPLGRDRKTKAKESDPNENHVGKLTLVIRKSINVKNAVRKKKYEARCTKEQLIEKSSHIY